MAATIRMTVTALFIDVLVFSYASPLLRDHRRTAAPDRRRVQAAGAEHRDPERAQRRLLQPLELDERLAVAKHRLQPVVVRRRQIALRLDDEIVRRHADLELAALGVELLRRELARRLRRLHERRVALHL